MDRAAWNERYREKELLWTAEPNRFLVEAVAGLEPGTALDLAAGEGRNAVWLAGQGWRVDAVDFSTVALDKGRALAGHEGVEVVFEHRDLTTWGPPPDSYDLVIVVYLHLPLPVRRSVWRGAAAAVGPAGRLVVIGHDLENLTRGYGGPQQADVLYRAEEVAGVVSERLEVLRADEVIRTVETEEGVAEAIDNIVIAVSSQPGRYGTD